MGRHRRRNNDIVLKLMLRFVLLFSFHGFIDKEALQFNHRAQGVRQGHCAVAENNHTHPKKGQRKFLGGGRS